MAGRIQWLAQRWVAFAQREGVDAMVADMLRSELFKVYANRAPRFRRHMAGLIRATPPIGLRHTLSEVLGKRKSLFRMTEALKLVKVPTLVMLGQHDYLCRSSSRLLADTIPGAAFSRIAGSGHIIRWSSQASLPPTCTTSCAHEIATSGQLRMLRLTELRLPLDHAEDEIETALLKRLQDQARRTPRLFGVPPRRRCAQASAIALIYTLDVEVRNEAARAEARSQATAICRSRPT